MDENSTFNAAWDLIWELKFQFLAKPETEMGRYVKYIMPVFGDVALKDITPFMLEKWKIQLQKSGLSPYSVIQVVGLVRRVFNSLIDWELSDKRNPASRIKLRRPDNKRYRFLEEREANSLLKELKEHSLQTWQIALLSLSTGARAGEVLNLTGNRIDLPNKLIRIVDSKTEKNRTVYLPKVAEQMLSEVKLKNNLPVFRNKNGMAMKSVSKTFPRVVEMLGLNDGVTDPREKVVFHTLRHTFASWLVQNDVSLHVVGELLGHSTLEMTRRYAHLDKEIRTSSIIALDAYIDA
jgi:integrase